MRNVMLLTLLAMSGALQPAPPPPPRRVVPDEEYDRLLAAPEGSLEVYDAGRLIVGQVERALEQRAHFHPVSGAQLFTVRAVMECMRDHGEVLVKDGEGDDVPGAAEVGLVG